MTALSAIAQTRSGEGFSGRASVSASALVNSLMWARQTLKCSFSMPDDTLSSAPWAALRSARASAPNAAGRAEGAVLALIADVGNYPVTALTRSKRLADDLGYDSLLQLRLLDRLRKEYPQLQHVAVADLLPRIHNVGDLVDFVVHRLDKTA